MSRVDSKYIINHGISMGTALAIVMSWGKNHHILWAIFHGFCSWFYVVYYWAKHS